MPTQLLRMRDVLARGLRRHVDDPAEAGLKLLHGPKPMVGRGLVPVDTPTNPVTNAVTTIAFPYTKLLKGSRKNIFYNYVSGTTTHYLYELNASFSGGSTNLFSSNQLDSVEDNSTPETVSLGTYMQYAEFDDNWLITNGKSLIVNTPHYGQWVLGNYDDIPVPLSVCIHDGMLYIGGIYHTGTYFDSGFGQKVWETWNKYAPLGVLTKGSNVPNGSMVMWGLPGGGSSSKPFAIELCALTGYGATDIQELVLSAVRNWQMGFAFIPWEGDIYAVKPLGGQMVVYGAQGIGFLREVSFGEARGYRVEQILDIGIAGPMAVAGGAQEHVFMDSKGYIWRARGVNQFERLDYSEFFASFVGNNPHISLDVNRNEYYLTKSDAGYILTEAGLASVRRALFSILNKQDDLYGTFVDTANSKLILETGNLDLDSRKPKLLEFLEVGKETLTGVTGQVYYKARQGSWNNTTEVAFGDAGIVDFVLSAIDFRARVEMDTYDGEAIPYLNANFRLDEKYGLGEYL